MSTPLPFERLVSRTRWRVESSGTLTFVALLVCAGLVFFVSFEVGGMVAAAGEGGQSGQLQPPHARLGPAAAGIPHQLTAVAPLAAALAVEAHAPRSSPEGGSAASRSSGASGATATATSGEEAGATAAPSGSASLPAATPPPVSTPAPTPAPPASTPQHASSGGEGHSGGGSFDSSG